MRRATVHLAHLLGHDARDLSGALGSSVRIRFGWWFRIEILLLLVLLLLRELEADVVLANGRSHRHGGARTSPGSKHEVRRELRAARRSNGIGLLLLLSGKRSEPGGCEAL